jgi:hypothetical protein
VQNVKYMGNGSIFKLDRKFTRELRHRLLNPEKYLFESHSKLPLTDSESVPSVEQIEEIILALSWASMQGEEGRLSRFRVTFAAPLLLSDLALVFQDPKRWSVEELRKLAPAVLPPDGQIGIWPYGENGELHIWGLQTTGLLRLTFEVIDPGRFIVSHLGFRVAEITGQRAGFISSVWSRQGLEIMSSREADESDTPTGPVLSYLSIYVTQEILRRVRLLGHGGAIVFVPDGNKWKRSVDQPVFYACNQRLSEVQRIMDALKNELRKIDDDNTLDERRKLQMSMEILGSHSYKVFIGNAARSIAYLSAVDGATVLSKDFEVLAFGAKLKARRKGAKAEAITRILPLGGDLGSDQVTLDQEFRGTRHLSAARFVFHNPGSAAFVVSQDGGITGFVMDSLGGEEPVPKLLAYRGLELLL